MFPIERLSGLLDNDCLMSFLQDKNVPFYELIEQSDELCYFDPSNKKS